MLYTVHFTTRKLINKLDSKGNIISKTQLDTPISLTALPHATAMSYSGCDNFRIEPYQPETDRRRVSDHKGIGNGTRKVEQPVEPVRAKGASSRGKSEPASGLTSKQRAAITGNLGAALDA